MKFNSYTARFKTNKTNVRNPHCFNFGHDELARYLLHSISASLDICFDTEVFSDSLLGLAFRRFRGFAVQRRWNPVNPDIISPALILHVPHLVLVKSDRVFNKFNILLRIPELRCNRLQVRYLALRKLDARL